MKKFLSSLSGLVLVALLIMGTSIGSTFATNIKSPLRGTWSFSEFVPATPAFHTPTPIPTVAAGTLLMKEDNSFTGHTVINTDQEFPYGPVVEFDLNGSCTFRPGGLTNGMDCSVEVPAIPASVRLFCVPMEGHGTCFDEFRCVRTTAPGVQLVEFKRQRSGTCQ